MDYQWIERAEDFRALAGRWDRALQRSQEDNPFLWSEFILTWWSHFGDGGRLCLFVAFEGDHVVSGLPLYRRANGDLEFIGDIAANYTEWLSLGPLRANWQGLLEGLAQRRDWQCVRLRRYRKSRLGAPDDLQALGRAQGVVVDSRETDRTYLIRVSAGSEGCVQHLPPRLRTYLRQSERALIQQGPLTLRSSTQWDTVRQWFDLYCQLSCNAFRARGQDSAFEDERYAGFFKELLRRACACRYIDANVLAVGERIIAIHFGYSTGTHLNWVLTTFDSEVASWRPGHMLLHKLTELAAARGNPLIDLYPGEKLYKRQWSNEQEPVMTIELWRQSARARVRRRLRLLARESPVVRTAERTIRRAPRALRLARRLKRMVRAGKP